VNDRAAAIRAVFFDVDFTLIYPGPTFQGIGYRDFCAQYGIDVDPDRFEAAVAAASVVLDARGGIYDPQVFVTYTQRIIEGMGGSGASVADAARDIYDEWASCHHFEMYDDVADVLRTLHARGFKIGLISNTQRCLASFERHFALEGLFAVALSSADHGYMKPHRSIFEAALRGAGVRADESIMVGDSYAHDIEGARSAGMRAVLVARSGRVDPHPGDVPVISSLRELPALLSRPD
jgi:putative hydrolase of the HAD superfamily